MPEEKKYVGESSFRRILTKLKSTFEDMFVKTEDLATVATSGSYNDLTDTPELATVATSGDYDDLSNKPNLATVATSGSYDDLSHRFDKRIIETLLNTDETFTIPSNANLNSIDYLKVKTYRVTTNSVATTLTNSPTKIAFMMFVYAPISASLDTETTKTWEYRVRKIIDIDGNEYIQKAMYEIYPTFLPFQLLAEILC